MGKCFHDVENCKKSHCELGKDEAFLSLQSSMPRSPIVLNRTRHRMQGCDLNDNNISAARCVEQDLPENSKFNQGEIPQKMQSEDGPSCTRRTKTSKQGPLAEDKSIIWRRLEFLITGFSCAKERELGEILQKFGGIVLSDIPSYRSSSSRGVIRSVTQQLPLQTSKFLYGCAVNASILKAKWVTDSIGGGTIASPERYLVLPNQADKRLTRTASMNKKNRIFDRVGIMLHGKPSFCRKLSLIIKHGGGEMFKTLQNLL